MKTSVDALRVTRLAIHLLIVLICTIAANLLIRTKGSITLAEFVSYLPVILLIYLIIVLGVSIWRGWISWTR